MNRRLNLDEFFDALRRTPRKWNLDKDGRICFDGDASICPRTYIWTALNFSPHEIYFAADNTPELDPQLRNRLLAACGLTP